MQFGRTADWRVLLLAWVFTALHYASTVYAVFMCPSVPPYVCLFDTSQCSTETDKSRITQTTLDI